MLQLARASDGNHTFVGDIHRPDPGVQQGVRRRAGILRADRLDRRRAQARRACRARAEPRRQDRRPDRTVPAEPDLCRTEHYVLMEVEVDQDATDAAAGGDADLGRVRVTYTVAAGRRAPDQSRPHPRALQPSTTEIAASRDKTVIEAVVEQSVRARPRRRSRCATRAGTTRRRRCSSRTSRRSSPGRDAPLSSRCNTSSSSTTASSPRPRRRQPRGAGNARCCGRWIQSGGARRALLSAGNAASGASNTDHPRQCYDPAWNDFDQYSPTCPTNAGGSGT